ncbi:DNA-binding protein [Cupriavidus oxalaticus]|uniref:DNA-binding protein n=1 Tax=Cupriavidus oxalaticus TaxID=96344 RepID=A0A4P7LU67_9BURK|nr:DNA-binding protein [Cupriavidus oxalaticus]QBY56011.1 DNA-binding protein [Cupriavidus oxalaticus]
MPPLESPELQLLDHVQRIKERFPGRSGYRDQIRELARELFFTFGQRPSAQRVVSLLADNGRSPSMSTAQEEINSFWETLRQTSRIRIQRPDVPEILLDHLSQVASDVWQAAVAQSEATTKEVREQAVRQVMDITEQRDQLQAQSDELAARNATLLEENEQLLKKVAELDQAVVAEKAVRSAAEASAAEWKAEFENTQQLRRQEAELAAQALNGVRQQVEQLMNEQRRLLAVADDFKQAALRDRLALESSERRVAEALGRCESLLAAKEAAEGQQQRLAGQNEQLQRDLAQARSDRDSLMQTTAVEMAKLRTAITEMEAEYQRQTLLVRRGVSARNRAIKRAWRYRRSHRPRVQRE